ncbi:MAG TPA: cyclic nucleotide-binding domain-containing protein [Candidatus Cloacimonadota bacterium]|nr:cyclic nucleotide-binding domain-containing protein [Candidatus Cloacimonadota bacterium]
MNIYVRNHDIDLYKYLNEEQILLLNKLVSVKQLKPTEQIRDELEDHLVIPVNGRLDRIGKGERLLGYVFPGEIDAEAAAFTAQPLPYFLRAVQDCTVNLIDRHKLQALCESDPDLKARIQAAFNDALCLKIVRLTHLEH